MLYYAMLYYAMLYYAMLYCIFVLYTYYTFLLGFCGRYIEQVTVVALLNLTLNAHIAHYW